ncbi:MAG: hypothetical protein JKY94_17890 [Rhodobacteraceae bacterium]|nr:hypothetical protein [Paracoccaceae bacterium]
MAGGDRDPFTFDFDTMMTLTGRGPDVVQTLSPNRHRLIFFYTNTGAETTAVSILHPFVNATKDNVSFDQFQWTLGEFVPPVIVTTGVAGTRGADDTRVVQGLGPELITGDRDDFTTARTTLVDGATITADQLGTADLLDMSANVNARALYRPGNTLEANVTVRLPVLLQAVSGSGLYPLAGFNGSAVQDSKLVFLTDGEFSLHHVEVTPTSSTDQAGIYIGNRQNVSGETLFAAYVKQVSMKAVTIAPGVGPNPNELTFRVDWDGVAIDTGASRYLFSARNAAGTPRRAPLLLSSSNALLWGGDGSGVFQALNAGPGFDDGGPHTAVCYLNQTTSLFKMSVDGGVTLSGTLAGAVPPNLQELVINQAANFSDASLNGTNTRFDFFEGDLFDQWRT